MPAPANKAARRLLAACLSLTAVAPAFSVPARGQERVENTTRVSLDATCDNSRLAEDDIYFVPEVHPAGNHQFHHQFLLLH